MHDLKEIRKNSDFYKKKLADRNSKIDFQKILDLDIANRSLIQKKETLEQEKKKISKSKDEINFKKSKELSLEIDKILKEQQIKQAQLNLLLSNLPNIALNDVPIGANESFNKIVRKEGSIKKFNFKVKSHSEIFKIIWLTICSIKR